MVAAAIEGISKMEEALAAENVPPGVAISFVERVRKVMGTLTKRAGNLQDTPGPEAILRGHHHTA